MLAHHLAAELGIGRTTLWKWTRDGLLPKPERGADGRTSIYTPAAIRMARSLAEAAR